LPWPTRYLEASIATLKDWRGDTVVASGKESS
jgi:hypothetical protein